MARKKQAPPIATRVSTKDFIRLEKLCQIEGKTKTQVLREALITHLDSYEREADVEERDRLSETLLSMEDQRRKDTERLAKMMARIMMDVGIINQVFYKRAAEDDRDHLWRSARAAAAERLKHKRKGRDPEATEIADDALGS